MESLQNKVAIVTGGGSGINLAFCKLLHRAGCRILIADIALHLQAQQWIASTRSESPPGPQITHVQTDVTKWEQLENIFDVARAEFGTIPDIVVPGAGVYEPSSNSFWADQDCDSRYKVLDINLVHPIKLSRIAIRHWVEAKRQGTIIHVSSIAGQRSSIVTPLYTASKHGISSFIWGMAPLQELVGIRVVGVAPG
jgi:3-hydroxybutyrate dehydrogenase